MTQVLSSCSEIVLDVPVVSPSPHYLPSVKLQHFLSTVVSALITEVLDLVLLLPSKAVLREHRVTQPPLLASHSDIP